MVDQLSPLAPVLRLGRYGNAAAEVGVALSETQPGSIVQVAAWPDSEQALIEAVGKVMGLELNGKPGSGALSKTGFAFGIAPGKFLVISDDENLEPKLLKAIPSEMGTVTDLSHGRTAIRITGPKAEWVLSKLFAVDFALKAFPFASGVSTKHHEIFAQIQRTGPEQFDLYVFRSFARSFWHTLTRAAEEVGYQIN